MKNRPIVHFALFFVLSILMIGALRSDSLPNASLVLWGLMIVQLVWAAWLYPIKKATIGKIGAALAVLGVVQVMQYGLNVHSLEAGTLSIFDLVRYLIFIGLVEELWFRGILQESLPGSPVVIIVTCAVVFGLYHIQQGLGTVLTTTAVGFLFSIARYCGAGVLSLAAVHGIMNWLNNTLYPSVGLRVELDLFYIIFPLGCIAIGSAYLVFNKKQMAG